ncbi:MAG: 1-deoxy-D-xylulose-5-phosphate synthase [Lachnospiraceae bacterium]|nr:1-deoxy-D-xylulose-5-phosphate synthase [Lachnospiraceae bacterium]
MSGILDRINEPNDIKTIAPEEYRQLAKEIRRFLIQQISRTGGHLASNLGVVELTMALHLTMNFPEDKLIWDVGHQAYTHKILTGRKRDFATLRRYEGLSGFPKRKESDCDAFDTGHSSTSISAACGLAKARDLSGGNYKVVAVIGDGALSGGMAYEGLNNAARMKSNLIIVLNDNTMSIAPNVGGMANYLAKLRTDTRYTGFKSDIENSLSKIPGVGTKLVHRLKRSKDSLKHLMIRGMLFEEMGLTYIGPIDGHDVEEMKTAFETAARADKAVLVHVITQKGKGYDKAEKDPSQYHGVEPFDIKTGKRLAPSGGVSYTQVFSDTMIKLAAKNDRIVAITAAMPQGTGLAEFEKQYPSRFFDVGIAEEHAVTFAAGLAAGGYRPVVAIYSTFLQRAYDQILHDVCVGRLPVVFAIDRAGIVGNDGETHQGIFDISYLSHMPGMVLMAPKNRAEFEDMLEFAVELGCPAAVRYPRGACYMGLSEYRQPLARNKSEVITEESGVLLLAAGSMVETGHQVHELLAQDGIRSTLVNVRFLNALDEELIMRLIPEHDLVVTMEENVKRGGFGELVDTFLTERNLRVRRLNIALPDEFLEHGNPAELKKKTGLDAESIVERIQKMTV